jgi:UDP-glucose 4-epimerase
MKAVVTGGAGFIGSALVDRLLEQRNEVVVVDNLSGVSSGGADFLKPHFGEDGFALERVDVLDLDALRRCVVGADVIFHLAAQTAAQREADLVRSQMANATGTLNVLLAAKNAGVRKVVSCSSSLVYGSSGPLPVKETAPARPSSPIGTSKLAAEEYCRLFHDLYGLKSVSLRFFTVLGPRQRPGIATSENAGRILIGHRPCIRGDGDLVEDCIFVSDAVEAMLRCTSCPDLKGQPINICSGSATTKSQIVSAMLEIAGRLDLEPEHIPSGPDEEGGMLGDNTLAKDLLGWEPKVPMKRGLAELMEWYEKYRPPTL